METEKKLLNFEKNQYPLIMGILNVTPDSFFDGGKNSDLDNALKNAEKMVEDGAHIIDIGGESTRPGAKEVSVKEELERVIPIVKELKKRFNITISVDTTKSRVAEAAYDLGVEIINDVSFGDLDSSMFEIVSKYNGYYIGMHMKGTPRTMQNNPTYKNVVNEVSKYLIDKAKILESLGVDKEKIIIDPGIGFGKNDNHNIEILKNIDKFNILGYPVLIGASRKSLMGRLLNLDVEDRLSPSIAIACFCALKNVSILRVHDVFETVNAIKMLKILAT